MIDINELRRLTQAVVKGWGNCDQAWLDQSEDTPAAVVGHIDEDGETYPVATIDCDQYYAGHQSLPLARFYAAANPAAISELLDRLEAAEKETASWKGLAKQFGNEADALRAKIERMERQEPVAWGAFYFGGKLNGKLYSQCDTEAQIDMYIADRHQSDDSNTFRKAPLYALPGAKGE